MSFNRILSQLPLEKALDLTHSTRPEAILPLLQKDSLTWLEFAQLLAPSAPEVLEALCRRSHLLTQQRFGRVIRLFAPLYLSNECINNCQYCGFSRDNPILRVTLSVEEVVRETQELAKQGFRNVLLVAGEHPKFVSNGYVESCIRAVAPLIPSLSLELGPLEQPDYLPLARAGAEGLVVYQETYDKIAYQSVHTAGPKKDFEWRLDTPERAYRAGFRRLGIGALFGLSDWRSEALRLAAHAQYLLQHCWKAQLTLSLPRLRPCAGQYVPTHSLTDTELVRLIAALRLFLPDVGIVLSTREAAPLRNGLFPLGVTLISAGSHTEPGGYTGAGKNNLHLTTRGRHQDLPEEIKAKSPNATGQFDIADHRSPSEVAAYLNSIGYEPVWKDWDTALQTAE